MPNFSLFRIKSVGTLNFTVFRSQTSRLIDHLPLSHQQIKVETKIANGQSFKHSNL